MARYTFVVGLAGDPVGVAPSLRRVVDRAADPPTDERRASIGQRDQRRAGAQQQRVAGERPQPGRRVVELAARIARAAGHQHPSIEQARRAVPAAADEVRRGGGELVGRRIVELVAILTGE
jgi:hypothetical protein